MTRNRHAPVRIVMQDPEQTWPHPRHQRLRRFPIRNPRRIQHLQPVKRTHAKLLLHFLPAQSRPIPEIHLPQIRHHLRHQPRPPQQRRNRLLHPQHRTRIHRIQPTPLHPPVNRLTLTNPQRRQRHVNPTTPEHFVTPLLHFSMPDQIQLRRMIRKMRFHE